MNDAARLPIRTALISLSDKSGAADFAAALHHEHGVDIVSTGNTARALNEAGVPTRAVSDLSGFPEIMDGRVKTLHPKIHGGILGRPHRDAEQMAEHGITPIDLVVVNLYPFASTAADPEKSFDDAIENIDIGGPAMIRAAAKNHAHTAVVVDAGRYPDILEQIAAGGVDADTRRRLAGEAFAHTAAYDIAVARWLQDGDGDDAPPPRQWWQLRRVKALRYGENPHQRAALYRREDDSDGGAIAEARQLQGKELSYNNIADADAAWGCARSLRAPACVIVKHANPCGAAEGDDLLQAYDAAYATDPTSAFGGVIAFNAPLDAATASQMLERQFVEVLVAPDYAPEALEALRGKPAVRALQVDADKVSQAPAILSIDGGALLQDRDLHQLSDNDLKIVSRRAPDDAQLRDLRFAWRIAHWVKSNAIVYAGERRTLGVGAGQMSRVYSARIAAIKAADFDCDLRGAVMASDAFFPFRDGIDTAAETGVAAVIQPGGSVRDDEVIAAADEHDMAMVFTGVRHFRH